MLGDGLPGLAGLGASVRRPSLCRNEGPCALLGGEGAPEGQSLHSRPVARPLLLCGTLPTAGGPAPPEHSLTCRQSGRRVLPGPPGAWTEAVGTGPQRPLHHRLLCRLVLVAAPLPTQLLPVRPGLPPWMSPSRDFSGHLPWLFASFQMGDHFWLTDRRPQGEKVLVVLQHHVPVQGPLRRVQLPPLLLAEVYGHIPESHRFLRPGFQETLTPFTLRIIFEKSKVPRGQSCLRGLRGRRLHGGPWQRPPEAWAALQPPGPPARARGAGSGTAARRGAPRGRARTPGCTVTQALRSAAVGARRA